jgi:predicted negative regulator of RcsB-dependent stress response
MPKHPTASRVHRDPDGSDDAFVTAVRGSIEWARANTRALTIGVAAVVLVAAGSLYYLNYQRTLENSAANRLAELQQTVASGNAQLAIRDLQAFIDRFGGAAAASPARLILADLLVAEGRPEEAVDALGDLPRDLDDPFGIAAARLLAGAHESLGRPDQAVAVYTRLAQRARFPYQAREALADAARVRLQAGDPAAAADLYQRVLDTFDDDEARQQQGLKGYYEMWLAEARARADQAAAASATPDTTATG